MRSLPSRALVYVKPRIIPWDSDNFSDSRHYKTGYNFSLVDLLIEWFLLWDTSWESAEVAFDNYNC